MLGPPSGPAVPADAHVEGAPAARGLPVRPDRREVRTRDWGRGDGPVVSVRDATRQAGAALFDARLALAAAGWGAEIERLPTPDDPDLLATIRPVEGAPDAAVAALAGALPPSRPAARPGTADRVPDDVLAELVAAAAAEETMLVPVVREDQLRLVHRLVQESDGPGPPWARLPALGTAILLASATDDSYGWLRSGEACRRVLLDLARRGWRATPTTRPVEVAVARTQLRSALAWHAHPQTLLLLGG